MDGEPRAPVAEVLGLPEPETRHRFALGLLVVAQLGWCAAFIARAAFSLHGALYFCLFDDALISMAYARNLVAGYGLNWARQGPPVEGFTHPLWVLLMVPVQLLGLPLRLRGLPVQLLSAALLAANTVVIARLARRHFSARFDGLWLIPALATAFFFPLNFWALVGMESGLQALLTTLAVSLALDVSTGEERNGALWAVLTAGYLLRMDMLLLAAVVCTYLVMVTRGKVLRRPAFRAGAALFILAAAGYEVFRWAYFGDLLPNTYYLKLTGIPLDVRLLQGMATFGDFARQHGALLVAVAAGIVLSWRAARRAVILAVSVVVVFAAYDVWVGGDAFEGFTRANRFLCFALPLLFLVIGAGCAAVVGRFRAPRALRWGTAVLAAGALVVVSNGLAVAPSPLAWRAYLAVDRPPVSKRSEQLLERLERFQQVVAPSAVVATSFAGLPAFFSDYKMIDILGYNDREIARLPPAVGLSRANFRDFRPGHMKWDYERIFARQPDAFFTTFGLAARQRRRLMRRHGFEDVEGFFVRQDSTARVR